MEASFFEFDDYRKLLEAWLQGRPQRGHGERSRLAAAMKCHTAFVTHVLKRRAQLSPEQALRASQHLGHSADESKFFLTLVMLDRAGTTQLKQHYREEIAEQRARQLDLSRRVAAERISDLENKSVYYGRWDYIAIHICLSVPTLRKAESIARALRLPLSQVRQVLAFFSRAGLATRRGDGSYETPETRLHLEAKSPLIYRHHSHWRLRAIESVERDRPEDLHYSSVISIHSQDESKVRKIMLEAIEKIRRTVRESSDPLGGVYSYCMDFFPVALPEASP